MIFHLMRKDLRKTWVMDLAFVGFSVLLCSVVLSQYSVDGEGFSGTSGLMMAGLMLYMLVFGNTMNIEKYEEKHKGYRILAGLPVSGIDLALSKYLIVLLHTVLGVAALQVIYDVFGILGEFALERLKFLLISGAVGLVLNGVSYLGVFKYGYRRMRAVIMALYLVCLIAPQLTIFLLATSGDEPDLIAGIGTVGFGIIAAVCATALVAFLACAVAAGRAVERPEV